MSKGFHTGNDSSMLAIGTDDGVIAEGWPAEDIFKSVSTGCGFDDIVLLPGQPLREGAQINIDSWVTKNKKLRTPLLSGPSENVTEVNMAIAMALRGGIGILHRLNSVDEQAAMVRQVKQFESGFILDPCTMAPHHTVAEMDKAVAQHNFSAIPITDNGKVGGKLKGLVTRRDVECVTDRNVTVATIMVKVADLVVGEEPIFLHQADEIMMKARVGKLPVVNDDRELVALVCRGDLKKMNANQVAARDAEKKLLVGASVGANSEADWERALALVNAGVDILSVDTDDGISEFTISFLERMKSHEYFTDVDVIVGRIGSLQQAKLVLDAGADGLRVGGSLRHGSAAVLGGEEASHLYEIARHVRADYGVPIIADCGLSEGQILRAFALGASAVVMDDLLDCTEEVPGDHFYHGGVRIKLRHASSSEPWSGQGVCIKTGLATTVVDKGSVETLVPVIIDGLRQGLRELGIPGITELHAAMINHTLRMERQFAPAPIARHVRAPVVMPATTSSLSNRW